MQFPEISYPFPFNIIELDNKQTIAYTDEGSGELTLLFVHGLASYMPAWRKNINSLKSFYRCVSFDLPGYGKSTSGDHSGSVSFYADIIIEFIEKLQLHNVTLVGHSMGGHISIYTTLKHPHLFSDLILLAPAGPEYFNETESDFIKNSFTPESLLNAGEMHIRAGFNSNFYRVPADIEFQIADRLAMMKSPNYPAWCRVVAASLHGLLDQPVAHSLSDIKARTLIIFGKNDRLIPHPALHPRLSTEIIASRAANTIVNCKLELIDQCGHFLQFEKPDEINRSILNFLAG